MKTIPFSPPDIGEDEISAVSEVLRSGWITTGPAAKHFEAELAKFCGVNRVVCLNSATAAEELNLRVLGISEGDEVIVPAYTYTSTASAAIRSTADLCICAHLRLSHRHRAALPERVGDPAGRDLQQSGTHLLCLGCVSARLSTGGAV